MIDEKDEFEQGLADLIWQGEKLNAYLFKELARTERLAAAVRSLESLNDTAQDVIRDTLLKIGVWKEEAQPLSHGTQEMAQRFANGHAKLQ